jgi:hypothetical protein
MLLAQARGALFVSTVHPPATLPLPGIVLDQLASLMKILRFY